MTKFSELTMNDIEELNNTGSLPLSLLKDESSTQDQIVNRYQSVFCNENLKLLSKSSNDSRLKILKGSNVFSNDQKYSVFTLEKPNHISSMIYPLSLPYKTEQNSLNVPAYKSLKSEFSKAFGIKVYENNKYAEISHFKNKSALRSMLFYANKGLKLCLTVITFGKKKFTNTPADNLKGKLTLKYKNSLTDSLYSETDKITKMYNFVATRVVDKFYKKNKIKCSNESTIKLISSLIATQYVSTSVDFGNPEVTKNIYSALSLQISNSFASLKSLSQTDKNTIISLATNTTKVMLSKLNKSPSNIISNLNKIGLKLNVTNEASLEDIIFGKAQQQLIEINQETNEDEVIIKSVHKQLNKTTLKRSAVIEQFNTLINEAYTEMIESCNKKLNSNTKLTEKTKAKIIQKREFFEGTLSKYNSICNNKSANSIAVTKKELSENENKLSYNYFTKEQALNILNIRDNIVNKYFDEQSIKQDKLDEVLNICNPFDNANFKLTKTSFVKNMFSQIFNNSSSLKSSFKSFNNQLFNSYSKSINQTIEL